MKKIGNQTVKFDNMPGIIGNYSIVGPKEGKGPMGKYFDCVMDDDMCGQDSFEKAERAMLEKTVFKCIEKSGLSVKDIQILLAGDLLNQIISSSFTARDLNCCFIGLFSACSTMTESIALGSCLVDGGYFDNVLCCTCSHFATAERQFRNPLELGSQRPPTSQWTVTGAGATIIDRSDNSPFVEMVTFGKVCDYGVNDVNNMGAAMAPAAMHTLKTHFDDTGRKPEYYDAIFTGDLGKFGSEILIDLMEKEGYLLTHKYHDCGMLIYDKEQKTFMGGSGCGCSASILNSFVIEKLRKKEYKNVLFLSTGALLSPTSCQQGESIPGIAHAIVLRSDK